MSRAESERLADIAGAIAAIFDHVNQSQGSEENEDNALIRDALLFQFVIIGEAVKHLEPASKESEPEIPWSRIAGLRDLIAHEYFRIEMNRIFEIVDRELPALDAAVKRLVETADTQREKRRSRE